MRVKYKKSKINFSDEFEDLTIEIIDKFGVSDEYQDILYKQRELLILKIDYLKTGKKYLLNIIKTIGRKLEDRGKTKSASIQDNLARVNSLNGTSYTVGVLTVHEYYSIMKAFNEKVMAIEAEKAKNNG